MNTLILCAVFKNESHILSEWLQHYIHRGVEHIYLVNDNSTDDFLPILHKYKSTVTLFHNDIVTNEVGRQRFIYEKYFRPIIHTSKWVMILDLDEFLYSPTNKSLLEIVSENDIYSQIKVDWLHFGSNGHAYQPYSVVAGFTKRAHFTRNEEFYSFKSIFKSASLISFSIHEHEVSGITSHMVYNDEQPSDLVINHYNLQSLDFFIRIKGTRGDINNWFDHIRYSRDKTLFERLDKNDVDDIRLFEQNKSIISYSDTISEEDNVTLVITSCNRPHLLEKTLESFVSVNTYPIQTTYIIDDSGIIGCNDAIIEKYKDTLTINSIYNPINIGQIQSIDKVYSYVRTKWIFHCEEDWIFLKPGFIEKSMTVFQENPLEKIYTVWLRPHTSTSGHPIIVDSLNRGYFLMEKNYTYVDKGIVYTWGGITFNPGLRKTIDCLKHHPYHICCDKSIHNGTAYVGEYSINKKYIEDGFYSMILDNPSGHIDHIGWNEHIPREWD